MYEHLLFEVKDHVATITLNRPELFNAISVPMRESIRSAMDRINEDDDIHIAVITGAGKAFSSGGDLKKMQVDNDNNVPIEERLAGYRNSTATVKKILSVNKPLIAAINGPAVGAGCSLAMLCDIRIASDKAKFGVPFAKRGLIPDWGGVYFLPRIVGMSRAMDLVATGRIIGAQEALSIKLVDFLVEHDNFEAYIMDYISQTKESGPKALSIAKQLMRAAANMEILDSLRQEEWMQAYLYTGDEHKEGVACYLEKRPPDFSKKS